MSEGSFVPERWLRMNLTSCIYCTLAPYHFLASLVEWRRSTFKPKSGYELFFWKGLWEEIMTMQMKVEIIRRDTIKPSSPTSFHSRRFKLSLFDQLAPGFYTSFILFYHGSTDTDHQFKIQQLKTSLSETLISFYPLAGRIKDNAYVECDDDGVAYVEARVNVFLSKILAQPKPEIMHKFFPIEIDSTEAATGPLLLIQTNLFCCGGLGIGVCFSHKLADAASMSTFIRSWAATALRSRKTLTPEYGIAALFPPRDFSVTLPFDKLFKEKCVTRRFVFSASNIDALKAKAMSPNVQHPTRIEAVSALIWKCATAASSRSKSALVHAVNIRRKMTPPLPETTIGNLVGYAAAQMEETETDLQSLVVQLRKGIEEFKENYVKKLCNEHDHLMIFESFKEAGNLREREDVDFYNFTSWCRLSLYEADFGWGKPIWMSIASLMYKNIVLLMDTREGDGIEAWVILTEGEMALFECNEELLEFAILNPSVSFQFPVI